VSTFPITLQPFGPHAIQIQWPHTVSEAILNDILAFESHLRTTLFSQHEQWEMVPAYTTLLVINREKELVFQDWEGQIQEHYQSRPLAQRPARFLWKIPVCYDVDFGPDLVEVSQKLQLSPEELIAQHTAKPYTVYGIGFLPGFMYLGGLPKGLEVPRRAAPRLKVAEGSVGLAGKQTGIYPQESPGGWNIIGRCSVPMFDASKKEPCFVSVGDKVQFHAISRSEYELHKIEREVGIYKLEKSSLHD
jgi:KipI family sensor histidine kinase inhibitor